MFAEETLLVILNDKLYANNFLGADQKAFQDEQETGPVLTVTNWKCRQTHRPSQRDGEETPCGSIYKLNLRGCRSPARHRRGTEQIPLSHSGSEAALSEIRLTMGSFAEGNAKAAFVMHQCP